MPCVSSNRFQQPLSMYKYKSPLYVPPSLYDPGEGVKTIMRAIESSDDCNENIDG